MKTALLVCDPRPKFRLITSRFDSNKWTVVLANNAAKLLVWNTNVKVPAYIDK